ncbi:hypothetical protein H9X85_03020 [Anaerotignum lactatifermentans]|uniref:Lipoprotein n=1 Tax=Anaerotignum lactatifermentans TaxID=160404 RepID=A0ABS2GDF5_9FIRM|nr:hypothetical protein [Anaerotignum lactatifermentans]MBM6828604.1 hypothetical protein [Anaerotignum lactatifermentans]MBM6878524.1 hypothetical protein [Anaerotignum lactatifermentans]MBM6950186.1 hypothetical protein [Anaerotignum lactatifermentans]
MKQIRFSLICGVVCLALAACVHGAQEETPLPQGEPAAFETLQVAGQDVISVNFSISPSEIPSDFLYISAKRETDADITFSFTKDAGNAAIGYYTEGKTDPVEVPLDSAAVTEETQNQITVSLKKGLNIFYITGDGAACDLRCQVEPFDPDAVTYSGSTRANEANQSS